jgi:hypothetical protein
MAVLALPDVGTKVYVVLLAQQESHAPAASGQKLFCPEEPAATGSHLTNAAESYEPKSFW